MRHPSVCEPLVPAEGSRLRQFCLGVIEEAFGHSYRPEWHADLDRLGGADDEYHPSRRGAFLVARHDGEVVGCGGLRALSTRSDLSDRFAHRYPVPASIGSIWRVYVRPDQRSSGIGKWLVDELERVARELAYAELYLHTSANSPRSIAFWERQGYTAFQRDASADPTVHLDKLLP